MSSLRITINGEPREIKAEKLGALCDELGYGGMKIATALNGDFVPAASREGTRLRPGDRIEIVAPRQGG
jgi:sulfur carrier protein